MGTLIVVSDMSKFVRVIVVLAGLLLVPAAVSAEPPGTSTAADLDRRITDAARRLETIVEQYNDARVALRETIGQRGALDGRLAPLQADLDARGRVLGGMAAQLYRHNLHGPDLTLLTARSPRQFVDQLLTLHQVDSDQRRAVAAFAAARRRLDDTSRALDALAAEQQRQQDRLAATRTAVEQEITRLRAMRLRAYGGGYRYADDGQLPAPPYVPGAAGRVVAFVFDQIGKPYVWGADGPGSYDCSGLTLAAWQRAGVSLPHNARRQYRSTAQVSRAELRPGDLVFYYGGVSHVGLYIGGGKIIHAPEYGERVRVEDADFAPVKGYGRPG